MVDEFLAELGAQEVITCHPSTRWAVVAAQDVAVPITNDVLEPGRQIMPDVWFALVALRASLRAVDLAKKAFPKEASEIDQVAGQLAERGADWTRARNVFEHIDEYFLGEGLLQRKSESVRPDRYLPMVATQRQKDASSLRSVSVKVGPGEEIDLFPTIDAVIAVLREVQDIIGAPAPMPADPELE